ncbi:hypothetical protein OV208_12840 [Corallococcus sp. bb12-1]|uniref:hypothetical protein n=1 Tax=Corallococcus sp. bb12-1 TaxID=2996784 RepID=UPI00226F15A5|nr:hypothetical protein [Corallococcus sp. bb12-1]MCY1042204.1 hypothetical protein [Corallococcus sp. bb12-1]
MKTLFVSLAFGSLLAACGGMETEGMVEETPSLATTEQNLCEGWDNGANRCTFKCTSGSGWLWYAPGQIAYGQCQAAADAYCGRSAYGACWSF